MIEVRNISKSFGAVRAVDDVSLRIERSEFLTLLGPSGCGKTTLLRIIAGFENPDRGAVLLDGEDMTRVPPYRRDVNQVFQNYALFPHMTVRENVAFGLKMHGVVRREREAKIAAALEMVSLAGLEDRRPAQLSGGQRQRVALARAIVLEPKVLLLDEPLAALDARLRDAMQLELKALQKRLGITFVFVTHDQTEALVMSSHIAVMNRGRIEQVGTPGEVYLKPATDFVANFVGQANVWEGVVEGDGRRVRVDDVVSVDLVEALEVGKRVKLLVRPEKLVVSETPTIISFPAGVVDRVFTGATTVLRLRASSGLALSALVLGAGDILADEVHCSIRAQDVVVLN